MNDREIPHPEDDRCPLIIPPLPAKPVTSVRLFSYLWTRAYEYLYEADEIVICGYSLPSADQLAVSMFSNFTNRHLRRVTIVDPSPDVLTRWRRVLSRGSVSVKEWRWCEDLKDYVTS